MKMNNEKENRFAEDIECTTSMKAIWYNKFADKWQTLPVNIRQVGVRNLISISKINSVDVTDSAEDRAIAIVSMNETLSQADLRVREEDVKFNSNVSAKNGKTYVSIDAYVSLPLRESSAFVAVSPN